MDEKELKKLAYKSVASMCSVIMVSACVTRYQNIKLYAGTEDRSHSPSALTLANEETSYKEIISQIKAMEGGLYTDVITGAEVENIGDKYIRIEKKSNESVNLLLEDIYMEQKIRLTLQDLEDKSYTKESVISSENDETVKKITLNYIYNPDTFLYNAVFEIVLDKVYVHRIYENKDYIYIEFLNPHDVYDKVIVVDAGHGGNDTGTASLDSEFYEKDINLSVVLYLKEMLDGEQSIKVYYTRLLDEKVYLNPRLNLGNNLKADFYVSVHCNASEYNAAKGTEVLYSSSRDTDGNISSKRLAKICLDNTVESIGLKDRGLLKNQDVYIIENARIPIALIELGFMSNSYDMEFLKQKENRKIAAQGIYNAIKTACQEIDEVEK